MAYQQSGNRPHGFDYNGYNAPPPPPPPPNDLYRVPSFERGDDASDSGNTNGRTGYAQRYRSPSTAGMQNAELYMGSTKPAFPPRTTSSGTGNNGIYQAQGSNQPYFTERPAYNPQQYMNQQYQYHQHVPGSAPVSVTGSHQPYNPAAYRQSQYAYSNQYAPQPQSPTFQPSGQPPPPPPRPLQSVYSARAPASPPIGYGSSTSPSSFTPPLPPRHQALPSLPGASNSSTSPQNYTPPAPPPPPFSAVTDAFPSNITSPSAHSFAQTTSDRPLSLNNPLPPLPKQNSPAQQRHPSPVIHRRPVPTTPSLPATPATPPTPGPVPPPHSPQRGGNNTQHHGHDHRHHPHARPLPGLPVESNQPQDYFDRRESNGSNSSVPDGRLGYDDLMQEVEAAVMGRPQPNKPRPSPNAIRASTVNGDDFGLNATAPLHETGMSGGSPFHSSSDQSNGHSDVVAESQRAQHDEYSDRSDAEADAGLAAMRMADEQDAWEEARRRSESTLYRVSRSAQQGESSDSDVQVDMSNYEGGFSGHVHYDHEDNVIQYPRSNATTHVPNELGFSPTPNLSGAALDSYGDLYKYPSPGQEHIHPFAPASVDTGETGGLSEPNAQPRRLSFEDGDETTLAGESEGAYTSGTQSPSSGLPEMFFHPEPGAGRPLPAAPVQLLGDQLVPRLKPASSYGQVPPDDQLGKSAYPVAPDAYQSLSPSDPQFPRSSSLTSHPSSPQAVPLPRSKTDADRVKILREQQLRNGLRSTLVYGSDTIGDASVNPSAELLGLPEIPAGKRGKFNPSKLSTSDFKRCQEPWALSSVLKWIRDMSEGEAYLKEQAIVDGIVALFTHKVPTMNTADAEALGAKLVRSMFQEEALLQDEEWVKFGPNPMSGVLYQLTGTGCYSPLLHSPDSPGSLTQEKPNRCYAHHCMRTLRKINLQTQSLEPKRKVEDWATFYGMKKEDMEKASKVDVQRQFNLHEIVTSEDVYMEQLEVLRVIYRDTLVTTRPSIIDPKWMDGFLRQVFGKADAVKQVNEDFLIAQLKYRQQEQGPWVTGFSDIFREWIRKAKTPYMEYSFAYPRANLLIRQEAERNVLFKQYLDQMRDHERSQRLSWDNFLKAPITRIQRYSLLLNTVLGHMPGESDEKSNLQLAIEEIKAVTLECNARVADMEKQVELSELATKLQLRPGMEKIKLNLTHLGREIISRGDLQRMGSNKFTWVDCHAILFDHYFVLAKSIEKRDALGGIKSEKYDISKVPIPMDLLILESRDEDPVVKSTMKGLGPVTTVTSKAPTGPEPRGHRQSTSNSGGGPGVLTHSSTASSAASIQTNGTGKTVTTTIIESNASDKVLYPFRVRHLGRTEVYLLYASTFESRREWCDKIIEAKTRHAASLYKQNVEPFRLRLLADTAFAYDAMTGSGKGILIEGTPLYRAIRDVESTFKESGARLNPVCRAAVNCATAFNRPYGIPMVAVGTDYGVYISDYKNPRGWARVGVSMCVALCSC